MSRRVLERPRAQSAQPSRSRGRKGKRLPGKRLGRTAKSAWRECFDGHLLLPNDFEPGAEREDGFGAETERLSLEKLDTRAASYEEEGQVEAAVQLMEQGLDSRARLFGPDSEEVLVACKKLGLTYNTLAMSKLYTGNSRKCMELLRKAKTVCQGYAELAAVNVQTFNNFACCYRRLGKFKQALIALRKSLQLLGGDATEEESAITHLNICAILSQLNKHTEAVEHAKAAVLHCQKQLLVDPDDQAATDEKIIVLGIAYHNLAVEFEFLANHDKCLQWYNKALMLANEHIGPDQDVTKCFRQSYREAKRKIERPVQPRTIQTFKIPRGHAPHHRERWHERYQLQQRLLAAQRGHPTRRSSACCR